ncbi:hypothetical protein CH64_866 [Yersinia rohdei]|uniref:Uncharacterized protein n=1 Tax=Yersinia rohdei TaxID=29485 RepID=A0A0U1HMM5_YERRO|nr:hypothetical protein CH64_866 [Yersinia rohdei]CNE67203.1 Uncharacterised protein [Yersinia rohdei]CNI77666.1 Uncharacterised protein [Yersinia rohdei]CQI87718.1 Uncharacterised protein [Yersinia rohdei]CQJ43734.1 Uncharacterised protein [Yersinia rohdei]
MNCEVRNIVTDIDVMMYPSNQVIDSHHTWFFYA